MRARIRLQRVAPLTTIQDVGRFGMLRHGLSASGPMDRGAFDLAGKLAEASGAGIEFTLAGLDLVVEAGECRIGLAGGVFNAKLNGSKLAWPAAAAVSAGDVLSITPGASGNYGYLRFNGEFGLEPVLGSRATSTRVRLGGFDGRPLKAGDLIELTANDQNHYIDHPCPRYEEGPIRFIWGIHAHAFSTEVQDRFCSASFAISRRLDRMGVWLEDEAGVFASSTRLSLVSDAVVPGDIQILGDGSPIVLMRDHQPTGGYPRIATMITADLDRFAQMRPGQAVVFAPVSVEHAHRLLRGQK